MKIKHAVIPVAGKGTRFLPASKEIPKEMIPIVNIPMIQYAVEEVVNSGIEEIILIISKGKESLEKHFSRNQELEKFLESKNKEEELGLIRKLGSMVKVSTVIQTEQLGLGHAILCAEKVVDGHAFAVLVGDDLILSEYPATKQLIDVSESNNDASVIGVMKVNKSQTDKYGIVDGEYLNNSNKTLVMNSMVEKPSPENAPTDLATPGRYILSPGIFECLREIPQGVGGEYQLTDAINILAQKEPVLAHRFDGDRFDTGNIEGYLNATLEFALRREDTRDLMCKIIKEKVNRYNIL